MGIFIYTVLKTNLPSLKANIRYINTFLRNELLKGTKGYYLSTLEAAIEYIEDLTDEKLPT